MAVHKDALQGMVNARAGLQKGMLDRQIKHSQELTDGRNASMP